MINRVVISSYSAPRVPGDVSHTDFDNIVGMRNSLSKLRITVEGFVRHNDLASG